MLLAIYQARGNVVAVALAAHGWNDVELFQQLLVVIEQYWLPQSELKSTPGWFLCCDGSGQNPAGKIVRHPYPQSGAEDFFGCTLFNVLL
jgi:hypothetical protein